MNAEAEEPDQDLAEKAAKTINKYVNERTEDVELSEYKQINVEMHVTQICGLADIHRATWYDNGVVYKLISRFESISYSPGNPIQVEAKQFMEEFEA